MNEIRPVLFSGTHMNKAIKDDSFYKLLPQFLPIKAKLNAMHASVKNTKGCSSCQQRRIQNTIERDFAAIVSSLSQEDGKVFKQYFGEQRMVIHAVNPITHVAYLKDI